MEVTVALKDSERKFAITFNNGVKVSEWGFVTETIRNMVRRKLPGATVVIYGIPLTTDSQYIVAARVTIWEAANHSDNEIRSMLQETLTQLDLS